MDTAGTLAQDVVDARSPSHVLIPCGAKIQVPVDITARKGKDIRMGKIIAFFESLARPDSDRRLKVFMWPLGSVNAPPILDKLGRALAGNQSLKDIARALPSGPAGQEELLDGMLLILWRALFRAKSAEWTRRGAANLGPRRTMGLARWWLKGQSIGRRPIYDGMCARCSSLLHGTVYQTSALSNKRMGPPIDIDDNVPVDDDGEPATQAQPPCLRRYSPQLFAKEAPAMFAYTEKTNCLSLREGKEPPWLRPVHGRSTKASEDCTWLYCVDCHKFLFDGDASHQRWRRARDGKPPSHIPFRDAASVTKRKPSFKAQRTQARIDELLARERPIDCHAPDGQEASPLLLGTESGVPSVPEVDAISEEAVPTTM